MLDFIPDVEMKFIKEPTVILYEDKKHLSISIMFNNGLTTTRVHGVTYNLVLSKNDVKIFFDI